MSTEAPLVLPIAALGESQTWRRDDYTVHLKCDGDLLEAWLATVGRDGDLAANPAEEAWFDAAAEGTPGVKRSYGPSWTVTRDAWPNLVARLGVWHSSRQLGYQKASPELGALLAAQLRETWWTSTAYWIFGPTDNVMFEVYHDGTLTITGGDPHLDALREHTGLAIEAPTPLHRRIVEIDRASARAMVERIASWSPHALSWQQATISVANAPPRT